LSSLTRPERIYLRCATLRATIFCVRSRSGKSDCRDRRRWGDAEDFANAMAEASVPASQEASSHLESVRRAFVALPRRDQLVIELAGLRGLNYDQVSGMLKVPSGTVRSRLSRARKRLSQIVEGGAAGAPA
jgi:RNA polymerase sigma factor (sigma-70 family)